MSWSVENFGILLIREIKSVFVKQIVYCIHLILKHLGLKTYAIANINLENENQINS